MPAPWVSQQGGMQCSRRKKSTIASTAFLDISTLPELPLAQRHLFGFLGVWLRKRGSRDRLHTRRTTTTDDEEEEEEGTEEGENTAALSSPSTTMGAAEADKDREREFDDEED